MNTVLTALLLASSPTAVTAQLPPAESLYAEIASLLSPETAADEGAAVLKALRELRHALRRYYADTGGRYPSSPEVLVPGYLPALPALALPGHTRTARVTVVEGREYDKDISGAVTDSGGWLYFSGAGSANRGLLVIDCSHKGPAGQEYFSY